MLVQRQGRRMNYPNENSCEGREILLLSLVVGKTKATSKLWVFFYVKIETDEVYLRKYRLQIKSISCQVPRTNSYENCFVRRNRRN